MTEILRNLRSKFHAGTLLSTAPGRRGTLSTLIVSARVILLVAHKMEKLLNGPGHEPKLSDTKVSVLENFFGKEPIACLFSAIGKVVFADTLKATTTAIRNLRAVANDEEQSPAIRLKAKSDADKKKQQTPVIFTNAFLEYGKKRKDIQYFLPLLGFDVDHISPERVVEVMNILRNNEHVAFAQPSSSRRGIHGVLYADTAQFLNDHWDGSHADAFAFVWEKMRTYVEDVIGEKIDEACKNPERSFALCYDELTFINPDAAPWHIDTSDYQPRGKKTRTTGSTGTSKRKLKHAALDEVKNRIENELLQQDCTLEKGRNNYVFRFAAICNTFGVDIEEVIAHCVSTYQEDDFEEPEIAAAVKSAYSDEKKHGTRSAGVRYATPDEVTYYINSYGAWRFNEVTLEYEVKPVGEETFRACKDEDANEIYRRALMDCKLMSVKQIETIIHSFETEHFNPAIAYKESLPKCKILPDGRCQIEGRTEARDYIAELADRLHTTSPVAEVRHYFKIWFVQMVKSWINPEEVNHYVFGLLGKQGIYKTTFFELLLPPELAKQYFDIKETNGQFGKDEMMKLGRLFLYLQEEVDEMTPKELNQFKAIASMKMVKMRLPYGRHIICVTRSCSFGLTGNKREILNDSTGSRRFFPFWVVRIDNPFDNPIDYEALYAQAFKLAEPDSGFISYVPVDEVSALNERNRLFSVPILEHEMVDRYLGKPNSCDRGVMESGGIITAYLQQFALKQPLDVRKVTAYLRQQEFFEKRTKKNTVFNVVHLKAEEIARRSKIDLPATNFPVDEGVEDDDDLL